MTKILDIAIVTYNRLEKLKKALLHYEQQTSAFRNLIIVNNCSTDGTGEFLKEYCSQKHEKFQTVLINTDENLGGSGGFYLGQKKALELNADWVMVADDDAYAAPDMVKQFYNFIEHNDTSKISAVCAAVYQQNGNIDTVHRRHLHTICKTRLHQVISSAPSSLEEYKQEYFKIDILSYVGSFLNVKALKSIGIVNRKYFIYFDDSEHSVRLSKYGKIIVLPSVKIKHDCGISDNNAFTWREYYVKRNKAHLLLHHFPRSIIKEYIFLFRCLIGAWLHNIQPSIYEEIDRTAMIDALLGRLGKHKIYRPGWSIPFQQNNTKKQ